MFRHWLSLFKIKNGNYKRKTAGGQINDTRNFHFLYSSELSAMNMNISLLGDPYYEQYFTRKYYEGKLAWDNNILFIKAIQFEQPVCQVLEIEGNQEIVNKFEAELEGFRKRHRIKLFLRDIGILLYFPLSMARGTFAFCFLMTRHPFIWFLLFLLLCVIRFFYILIRGISFGKENAKELQEQVYDYEWTDDEL